jgi:phosphosulfolactate phosphohydrolase-like enzyme
MQRRGVLLVGGISDQLFSLIPYFRAQKIDLVGTKQANYAFRMIWQYDVDTVVLDADIKDLSVKKFDNSPYLAKTENIKDNIIVITSSGSKAVIAAKNAEKIIIGSLCNITSVRRYVKELNRDVMIVPACIFFNKKHIEDFIVSEFIRDYIDGIKRSVEDIRKDIENAGRIDELRILRKTADRDIDLIFSIDIYDTIPVAYIKEYFAEVINEKSYC